MATVERLSAHVRLDDPSEPLARARAEVADGDESWQRWVAEYERGEAMIVWLALSVHVADGSQSVVETANRGVFVEKDTDPPKVEQQVAEIASKDFPKLAEMLHDAGYEVTEDELSLMYVHVELDEELRRSLSDVGAARRAARHLRPESEIGLSRQQES